MTKLFIIQGDDAVVQIALTNPDCTPIDLTDYGITFTIKYSHFDPDSDALWQGTLLGGDITIIGAPGDGVIQVLIPHANSVLMRQGRGYYWDVQLVDAANKISTPDHGLIFASMEVTDSV